jgi:hypothetical protein
MKTLGAILMTSFVLAGCDAITGKEVARLPINEVSTEANIVVKETTLDLQKDEEVAVWSDMDIEYEGDITLTFIVEVWRDGEKLGAREFDPTDKNVTIGEVKTTIMGKTNWSFSGRNSSFKIEDPGKYTFKGILVANENPSLKVTKAEVVFKK